MSSFLVRVQRWFLMVCFVVLTFVVYHHCIAKRHFARKLPDDMLVSQVVDMFLLKLKVQQLEEEMIKHGWIK